MEMLDAQAELDIGYKLVLIFSSPFKIFHHISSARQSL